jgi:hypothetical protein
MSDIEEDVLRTFLEQVADHEDITPAVTDGLRAALADSSKLPSADSLAQVFVDGSAEPLS